MSEAYNRNLQDSGLNPATFALPSAASTSTTSAAIDLGTGARKPENVELVLEVPALSDTILPNTRTATLIIETSTTSVFTAVARTILSLTLTGAGAGSVAQEARCRIPADCEQYVRAKVTFGGSTTDGSAVSATFTPRF